MPQDTTTVVESIRVLRVARDGAVKARTAALNQLKDLITTAPDALCACLRGKPLRVATQQIVRLRPDIHRLADPINGTKAALRSIATRIAELDKEIAAIDVQLDGLVAQTAPRTTALLGISTQHASQLLVTAGANPHRLRSEAAFAALCGASPIAASGGITTRRRLNPACDRNANRDLHMIAVVWMRWDPATRDYLRRRTKTASPNAKSSAASNASSPAIPTPSPPTSPTNPAEQALDDL